MDFKHYKIRCSSLPDIIGSRKPKGKLTEVKAKPYLLDVFIAEQYNRKRSTFNKYMTKGNEEENNSISLYRKVHQTFTKKNEIKYANDFIDGTPDLVLNGKKKLVIDIKTCWDIWTYIKKTEISAGRRAVVEVPIDVFRRACGHISVNIGVEVLRRAGRDVRVQVRVSGCASRHAVVKVTVRIEVRRRGRTLVHVAIGVQVGAVHRAGVNAVDRLIDRAGRNIRVLIDVRVGRSRCGRVLVDVRRRPRLDVVVRVDRRTGRRIDVVVVVRRRAGAGRDVIVTVS